MNAQPTPAQRSALKLTTSAFLDRAGLRDAERIVEQMADDCRVLGANADSVTAEDLELVGWSPAQIGKHGRDAARRAYARAAAAPPSPPSGEGPARQSKKAAREQSRKG